MDGGLGNNYRAIYQRCAELQSKSVFGRRLVVSPDPRLIESLREADPDTYARRRELFTQAVENTVEGWAYEKGINREYSFVVHAPTFGLERLREQPLAQEMQPPPPEPQLEIELGKNTR